MVLDPGEVCDCLEQGVINIVMGAFAMMYVN